MPAEAVTLSGINLREQLQVEPGEVRQILFSLTNPHDAPQEVRIYVEPHPPAPEGQNRSAAGWLTVTPEIMQLAPGESRQVEVQAEVPFNPRLEGSYWASVIVEPGHVTVSAASLDGGDSRVGLATRVVYRIELYFTIAGTQVMASEVQGMSIVSAQPLAFGIDVANLGNVPLHAFPWLEVRTATNDLIAKVGPDPHGFWILPGAIRKLPLPYAGDPLGPGTYFILGIVDYGGDRLIAGRLRLELQAGGE